MPGADNLKEEVGALSAEREIADFVDLCGAQHKSTYVECSLMWREICRSGSPLSFRRHIS